MEKKLIYNDRTDESYYYVKHPSGLSIYVMRLEGFGGTTAMFGTKYGSINSVFKTDGDPGFMTVPDGIAHFLEHKLFENEDCQAFELFSKTGASADAYTTFDRTVYYFDCTDRFPESLEILLDFVQKPYFTQETVDKEQGIIGQEIKMCEDNPYRRVYFNLLGAVYKNHPVKTEIAGTVESISKIDAELLYRCYNAFYSLENMVLAVAGNCEVDEVLKIADKALKPGKKIGLKTSFPSEPKEVAKKSVTEKMSVGIPLFSIGYKCEPCFGAEMIKNEYASEFLMSMIFGPTSRFFKENTASGLINQSFETETDDGEGYFMNAASGESNDPNEVLRLMNLEIERVKKEGLDRSEFDELKKSRYGSLIRTFNNVSASASQLLVSHMAGCGAFEPIDILAELTFEDVAERLGRLLNPKRCAISIIEPTDDIKENDYDNRIC